MNYYRILNVSDPTEASDAASKSYVDSKAGGPGGYDAEIQIDGSEVIATGADGDEIDSGNLGTAEGSVIQAALDSIGVDGSVLIKAGTYHPSVMATITPLQNQKIYGSGMFSTIFKNIVFAIDCPGVVLQDFEVANTSGVRVFWLKDGAAWTTLRKIYMYDNTAEMCIDIRPTTTAVDYVLIDQCYGYDNDGYPFMVCPVYATGGRVNHVQFLNCRAENNGIVETRKYDWIVGFDIAEQRGIHDVLVQGCYAANNWESGFHCEQVTKSEIRFVNCFSENNGIVNPTPSYGAGFVVSGGCSLTGCKSRGNYRGLHIAADAGTMTYPTIIDGYEDHDSLQNSIDVYSDYSFLSNVRSYNAGGYGLDVAMNHIGLRNIEIYSPTGLIDAFGDYSGCRIGQRTIGIIDVRGDIHLGGGSSARGIQINSPQDTDLNIDMVGSSSITHNIYYFYPSTNNCLRANLSVQGTYGVFVEGACVSLLVDGGRVLIQPESTLTNGFYFEDTDGLQKIIKTSIYIDPNVTNDYTNC